MGRGRAKTRRVTRIEVVDATPERIRMDESEFINPAEIDSSEQRIGLTRRFKGGTRLDRLALNGRLTEFQWQAGDWYRNTHHRCSFALSVVAKYGEQTSKSEISYGLPATEAQARARSLIREARSKWPASMQGYMDRFLVHDELPRYGGNQYHRSMKDIAGTLQHLSNWLRGETYLTGGRK